MVRGLTCVQNTASVVPEPKYARTPASQQSSTPLHPSAKPALNRQPLTTYSHDPPIGKLRGGVYCAVGCRQERNYTRVCRKSTHPSLWLVGQHFDSVVEVKSKVSICNGQRYVRTTVPINTNPAPIQFVVLRGVFLTVIRSTPSMISLIRAGVAQR